MNNTFAYIYTFQWLDAVLQPQREWFPVEHRVISIGLFILPSEALWGFCLDPYGAGAQKVETRESKSGHNVPSVHIEGKTARGKIMQMSPTNELFTKNPMR